ncbi:MAG: hypothetical protein AABZ77_09000 [Chloroflexota bacterium]
MNSKLAKVICLVILMVMVLLTGATPATAHSMNNQGAGDCESSPSPAQASVPLCCVTPDCPLAYSTTANLPPSSSQFTLSKLVQMVRLPASVLPESSFDCAKLSRQDTPQSIPRPTGADNYCRNSLTSEEPPLI